HAFVLSAIGFVVNVVYTYVLSDGGKIVGQIPLIMNGVIAVIILALIFYSRAMAKRGVLR
ncbi:MAG TPA: hypothetical protein VEA79_02195, partial [Phenylobacterium sp.]|nr:hypothetical protein [Phenylobacterium sp.]